MESIWILPDRAQRGPKVIKKGLLFDELITAIDISTLPPELTLGIPTELIRSNIKSDLLFAQYARRKNDSIFSISICSGEDRSGRVVYLTNLQILKGGEVPEITELECPEECVGELSEMENLKRMFNDYSSEPMKPVREMLEAVEVNKRIKTFCSHELRSSANEPSWMPNKSKKKVTR